MSYNEVLENDRLEAFTKFCEEQDLDPSSFELGNGRYAEAGLKTYLILTEEEAEELHEGSLDSYLEDVILSEMPEHLRHYFDEEKWKRDARFDGRGHALSSYDGIEHEVFLSSGGVHYSNYFFVYRMN